MDVNNELNIFASLIVTDGDNVILENVLDEDLDFINEEISKITNKNNDYSESLFSFGSIISSTKSFKFSVLT